MKQQQLKLVPGVMFLLWVLGALTGCIHKHGNVSDPVHSNVYSIRIILHGPFLTVLTRNDKSVVMLRADDHEGIFPFPDSHGSKDTPCQVTYLFTLSGVELNHDDDDLKIDPAFKPLEFGVKKSWRLSSKNEDYFMRLDLPTRPSAIGYVGALIPVVFKSQLRAKVPLTQVLEFTATDPNNVHLKTTRLETCGSMPHNKELTGPPTEQLLMPCSQLSGKYEEYWKAHPSQEPEYSDRESMRREFEGCTDKTFFYFLGAGLPPGRDAETYVKHGIYFFNEVLLPTILGQNAEALHDRQIESIGREAEIRPNRDQKQPASRYMQINFNPSGPRPLLVPVASTENCKSPGTIVH